MQQRLLPTGKKRKKVSCGEKTEMRRKKKLSQEKKQKIRLSNKIEGHSNISEQGGEKKEGRGKNFMCR